jgi:cytochrome P450
VNGTTSRPLLDPFTVDTDELMAAMADWGVVHGPIGPAILRHADVSRLAVDARMRGPELRFLEAQGISAGPIFRRMRGMFIEGDDHRRLRSLVVRAFTPRAVENVRGITRRHFASIVDGVIAEGSCEAVTRLCDPLPVPVIAQLIGVPEVRWEDMSRWAADFSMAVGMQVSRYRDRIETSILEMDDYLLGALAERRRRPGPDLLSALLQVEAAGDRLTTEELINTVFMLLVGGTDTTRNQLGLLLNTFCDHPDQWALLTGRPDLVPSAVNEVLRWAPAAPGFPRVTMDALEICGLRIAAGALVVLVTRSANRDPRALQGATEFDICRRPPKNWHLVTFGAGAHYCLGASLATLELQEALAELSSRMSVLRSAGTCVRLSAATPLDGFSELPIEWSVAR